MKDKLSCGPTRGLRKNLVAPNMKSLKCQKCGTHLIRAVEYEFCSHCSDAGTGYRDGECTSCGKVHPGENCLPE